MNLAEWTFVMAVAAVLVGLAAVVVPLATRHWDRVDLWIEKVTHRGDAIEVGVRNRGGGTSRMVRLVSEKGHPYEHLSLPVLAGRSNATLTIATSLLARSPWRECPRFRVVDDSGNDSPFVSFPATVKPHLEELIRVSPQIAQ